MLSKRQTDKGKKNPIPIIVFIVVILVVLVLFVCSNKVYKSSKIQEISQGFLDTGSVENAPEMDDNTPEYYYIQGLVSYANNDFEESLSQFKKAEKQLDDATDPALTAYLYCFLNSCFVAVEGYGNLDYVQKGLTAAAEYPPIANNHALIWNTANSIATDEETDAIARGLLQNIIDKVGTLSEDASIRYNNCIASLYFIDQEYSESIRRFYDVKSTFEQKENASDEYQRQLCLTNSYIAGFYFELKDFETAINLYEENIAFPIEDQYLNAKIKHSDYVNLSSSYIELGMPDEAEAVCKRMEEILPYLEPELLSDVRASIYDNMAQSEILKKDYKKAGEYINLSKVYLEAAGEYAYYGSEEFIKLTESELYYELGEYEKAREYLEELRDSKEAAYAGIEKDVYEGLEKVYDKLDDKDAYIENQKTFIRLDDEFNKTIQRGYLEFSKYYNEAEIAKRVNDDLREQARLNVAIIVVIIIALFIVLLLLLRIRDAGYLDQLTGIKNRRALTKLDKKYQNHLPKNSAIIMIDIDYFKRYNDFYGHLKGDAVLKSVAKAINNAIRKKDFLIRFGGEEFLIFIENASNFSYEDMCKRIITRVQQLAIPHEKSDVSPVVTISLGLCINDKEGRKIDDILIVADEALYEAKNNGRNRYVIKSIDS